MADINGIVPPAMPGENRGAGRGPSAVPARERSPVRRPAAEQGPGLSFVLHALRRWWVLATPVGLVLAALGGTIVYLLFERTYEAAAWLKIEDQMAIVFDLKYDDRANAFFKTQIEMIRSPIVLAPVAVLPVVRPGR